jgi:hypothetical protein
MAVSERTQADLAVKSSVYQRAKARMDKLRTWEREEHGRASTTLADIGRRAILSYKPGDGANFAKRIVRSPNGCRPDRTPFRFMLPGDQYDRQKQVIADDGHVVTQVVEEALTRFADTGQLPS